MKNILYKEFYVQFKQIFRIMRITALLLVICTSLYALDISSQTTKVTITADNVTSKEVIYEIERQTDYLFVYDNDVNLNRKISITAKNKTVAEVLNKVFAKTNIYYAMEGKNIMLMCTSASNDSSQQQQKSKITGVVMDAATGETIIGVNIKVKGGTAGAITALDGSFSLEVEPNAVLEVSYIGYVSQEIPVSGKRNFSILLQEDSKTLEEVVVVGYGVQKKSVVTAAISKVSADDLALGNPSNIQNAMKGKVSGVQIIANSGAPGSSSKIRIRGTGTVNNSDPLFIIDGMTSEDGIDDMNPNDIESIEILKDAASAAIYGARGANGVILVTTKKGSNVKPAITYDVSYGFARSAKKLDLMNSEEYKMMLTDMATNEGWSTPKYVDMGSKYNTDWQDELMGKTAVTANHKISLSGGNERGTYYLSFGYLDQEGIIAKDYSNYRRWNARLNNTYNVFNVTTRDYLNKLSVGSNISYSRAYSRGISNNNEKGGIISSMTMLAPTEYVYETDPTEIARYENSYPNFVKAKDGRVYKIIELRELGNPYAVMETLNNSRDLWQKFSGNFNGELTLLKGLKFRTSINLDWFFGSQRGYTPPYYIANAQQNTVSKVNDRKSESFKWQFENVLSYERSFGNHNLSVIAGTSAESRLFTDLYGEDTGLMTYDLDKAYIDYASGDRNAERVTGDAREHKMASMFARLNYNYKEKYMFETTVRRDGSSNFATNNKFAVFPSVSLGWTVTNEDFMKNRPSWLSFMKIRASWGQNGNENIGAFGYVSMMATGANAALGKGTDEFIVTGINAAGLANTELKWETSEQIDLGLDLRFFDGALSFTADYFDKKTKDMLLWTDIPTVTGYRRMMSNQGTMSNKGVEFELSYKTKIGQVNTQVSGNASYVKNNVTDRGAGRSELSGEGTGIGGISYAETGRPFGYFYGYVHEGIFQNQAEIDAYKNKDGQPMQPQAHPGDIRFKDVDGNGYLNAEDRTNIGDPNPDWTYGFSLALEWKGLDFNAFFQGVAGNQVYNLNRRPNIPQANWDRKWLGRWHGEGTSEWWPRITDSDVNQNTTRVSNLFIEDGDYLRLKALQIGYTLPTKLTQQFFVQKLRFYVLCENLFTITNYTGYDPEIGNRYGIDFGNYPQARTFNFGAILTF